MNVIKKKADVETFLQDLKHEIMYNSLGTFIFNDSKNNYQEHITQLRFSEKMWSALYSSEHNAVEWINNIDSWVWDRRKDINKELKEWNYNITPIKVDLSFKTKARFKGRGYTERPVCPHCGEDMDVSLRYVKGKAPKRYGVHCLKCKHQEWD